MEWVFLIVSAIVGIVIGYFITHIIYNSKITSGKELLQSALTRTEVLRSMNENLEEECKKLENDITRIREESEIRIEDLRENHNQQLEKVRQDEREESRKRTEELLRIQDEKHDEAIKAMMKSFDKTVENMRERVVNLTAEVLKERQKDFETASREGLNHIIEPLQQNIRQMQDAVQKNTNINVDYSGQLKNSIENVLMQSQAAKESADRLANALTVGTKVQGNWGEKILAEILESTGLKEGLHFVTQSFIRDDTGNQITGDKGSGLQPDVILHIDSKHDVIIDSKVSLTSFFRYNDAATEGERSQHLRMHIESLKRHVKELADKDYSKYLKGSLDYVIMFVPVSQALYLATANDRQLWREAMEKRVYIADEQTIYAALKIISLNWKQQAQAENHEQVYKLANEMLERVGKFMDKYEAVGKALDTAKKAFEEGKDKLTEGGQSIPGTCNKLIKLGARYEKQKGALLGYLSEE